jgi:hypothetical protein
MDVREVALLALLYREHYNARHTGPEGLLEDFEVCRGEVNFATMIGAETLTETDWLVVRAMDTGGDLNPLAADLDAGRAEALLHAWPTEAPPPDGRWTLPYGADRWAAVEEAMQHLRAEGLTASRDRVDAIAVAAYEAATGAPYDEDEFGE